MDFIDVLKQFANRVDKISPQIQTEEATKMSLIVPFFQALGYDVFNPDEFMPEFVADVGIKKGEKVDYAILKDGNPVILIECKWCGENLNNHSSQLFRYFGTTTAKFGILTNGITYKFFTDLDEPNKMDLTPFLEFDINKINEAIVNEIKKFRRDLFDIDSVFSTASELKYSKMIKDLMLSQMKQPSDNFVKWVLTNVYDRQKTQAVIDKFVPLVKKSLNDLITELLNEKITTALKSEQISEGDEAEKTDSASNSVDAEPSPTVERKIQTTMQELESYYLIKSIIDDPELRARITYRDTESYFSILVDNNRRKWVCRLILDGIKKVIVFPDEEKRELRVEISDLNDLYTHAEKINEFAVRHK